MAPNSGKIRKKFCIEIPEDIILEILLRLPVKSLLKFRSVCKAWRDLIGSRKFIDLHLNHPSQNTRRRRSRSTTYLVLKRYKTTVSKTLCFCSRGVGGSLPNIPLDVPDLPRRVRDISGPCNGIFLVRESDTAVGYDTIRGSIYLCNPATRKCRKFPNPSFKLQKLGFGFDHRTTEYKVVALTCRNSFFGMDAKVGMEILDLSSKSWREADIIFPLIDIDLDLNTPNCSTSIMDDCGLFFNGHLHWRMAIWDPNCWLMLLIILCFDMSNETMRHLTIPSDLLRESVFMGYGVHQMKLLVFEDSLALAVRDGECAMQKPMTCSFEIWIMKEYGNNDSWTKRYRIGPFLIGGAGDSIPRPLACWNDDMLLFQFPDGHIIRGCLDTWDDFGMAAIVMDKETLI